MVKWIKPCFPYFFDEDSLQVGILLSFKFQSPEVSESQLAVPVVLAARVTSEHEVEAVLLVVDQLMSIARPRLYDLPGGPVVRLVVLILVYETPASRGDLIHPETVTHSPLPTPALLSLEDNTQYWIDWTHN